MEDWEWLTDDIVSQAYGCMHFNSIGMASVCYNKTFI